MRPDIQRLFIWMAVFFIAMAFLESAVVVYLRAMYYPEGFDFPLVAMDGLLVNTEVGREIATMVMILSPAALVTRSRLERFAWFCFGFGVWDIFYYVWLKVLLDWPASLTDPDLLFLVPVPWVGPVWAPCVVSLGLISLGIVILRGRSNVHDFAIDTRSWVLLIGGAMLMILSFTLEPLQRSFGLDALANGTLMAESRASGLTAGRSYIPDSYPIHWFLMGCCAAVAGLYFTYMRGALQAERCNSSVLGMHSSGVSVDKL
ncbi:MAG: hypothetical protein WAR83_12735 [Flavobacteriales bacterium]|nr:hypothetical protein [Flavobacteriales bacterium]